VIYPSSEYKVVDTYGVMGFPLDNDHACPYIYPRWVVAFETPMSWLRRTSNRVRLPMSSFKGEAGFWKAEGGSASAEVNPNGPANSATGLCEETDDGGVMSCPVAGGSLRCERRGRGGAAEVSMCC